VLRGKFDGCLNISRGSCIDADDGHAPLLACSAKGSVEVAGLDCAIGKGVGLPVGEFRSARLIRTPDAVVPGSAGSFLRQSYSTGWLGAPGGSVAWRLARRESGTRLRMANTLNQKYSGSFGLSPKVRMSKREQWATETRGETSSSRLFLGKFMCEVVGL